MLRFAAWLMTRPAFLCGVLAFSSGRKLAVGVPMLERAGPHTDDSVVIITAGSGRGTMGRGLVSYIICIIMMRRGC